MVGKPENRFSLDGGPNVCGLSNCNQTLYQFFYKAIIKMKIMI